MKCNFLLGCLVCTLLMVGLTFPAAADTPRAPASPKPAPQKLTLAQAKKSAAQIKRGTTRAVIEKLYPNEDAGLMSYELTRYYLGNGIMVDVPFDKHGGEGNKQNRVNGPSRVYLSPPHFN